MTRNSAKQLDFLVYFLIAAFFVINLLSFDYSGSNFAVISTFFVIGIFSFYKIVAAKKNISLHRVFYIFTFIFFFFAPLQQYFDGTVFGQANGFVLVYDDSDYLKANVILILFIFFFELFYTFCRRGKKKLPKIHTYSVSSNDSAVFFLSIISLMFCGVLFATGNVFGRAGLDVNSLSMSKQILNIARFFPVACFIIFFCQRKTYQRNIAPHLALCVIEILFIYFPINGSLSRFLLFGTYLGVISLFFSHAKTRSLYFLLIVVGFLFIFSTFNFFKTNSLDNISNFSFRFVNFNHVDFDAYQMLMATVYYTEEVGVCYGQNLIAAAICFIPRSVWPTKFEPTGAVVAAHYRTWFTNLSCPWVAEFFFAFGWIGVVIGGLVAGWLFKYIDSFDYSLDYMKRGVFVIVSGLMIYILRGAMLPTVSYTYALVISLGLATTINRLFSARTINTLYARIHY